jgi:hypothetical protein
MRSTWLKARCRHLPFAVVVVACLAVLPVLVGPTSASAGAPASTSAQTQSETTSPAGLNASNVSSPLDKFYFGLLQDYSSVFGGWSVDNSGHYTIDEVGANASFEAAATNRWSAIPGQMGQTTASPELSFAHVGNSAAGLESVEQAIVDNLSTWANDGVIGVGIDQLANKVTVDFNNSASPEAGSHSVPASAASTEQQMEAKYGKQNIQFSGTAVPTAASTPYLDSAPWKGGDELYNAYNGGTSYIDCSAGPGLRLATGPDLLLTAGHCAAEAIHDGISPPNWFNWLTLVGTESAWWLGGGSPSTAGLDFGVIPTLSSYQAWQNYTTLIPFTGWFLPPVGASVCEDGYQGDYQCGTVKNNSAVILVNNGAIGSEWVNNLLQITGSLIPGDSGGAGWYPTVYGPLISGTNVASGGGYFYQEEITPELNRLSSFYGTTVTPIVY